MDRGVKIVLASGILAVGIAAAMLFRHPSPRARAPRPESPDGLVLRQENDPPLAQPPAMDRFTAQIHSPAEAPPPAGQSDRLRPGPGPDDPGQPPPPPTMARSYPPFRDRTASPGVASRGREATPGDRAHRRPRTHKIVDGDTLAQLAERYLGDAGRYLEIYQANRDLLPSPEVLPIGVELRIPPQRPPGPSSADVSPQQPLVPVAPASRLHGANHLRPNTVN
jgi:nucleoid-associated protein YgaU